MPKVLIADKMDTIAAQIFKDRGIDVTEKPGLSPDELRAEIGQYDGVAVRSGTKITGDMLGQPGQLRVIGRAGIGVDTINVPAATNAGVMVMNTPFGNSVTTAEHTIAMIMSLARKIPQANASTHAGKWEKSAFMGTELMGKSLGLIGCGNIGAIVADRALGLKMRVMAYDPFLTPERAVELGVTHAEFDEVLKNADFITVHTPLTDQTRGIINAAAIAKMKKGVRLLNVARGGLIVEKDLKDALHSGHVAGAAIDVFETEPATENILFGHPNVICTPHLGASTMEAQVNVARQIAEQMSDYLLTGAVTGAVNMPNISAEDAPRLRPYVELAHVLGKLAGQIAPAGYTQINIEYMGTVAALRTKPITSALLAALLSTMSDRVNQVNAGDVAKSNGISVRETSGATCAVGDAAINVILTDAHGHKNVTGTLFNNAPRVVQIDGVGLEAAVTPHMLFIRNHDQPGMIGALGTVLAGAGQNIADFRLGRVAKGAEAVALVSLDVALPDGVFAEVQKIKQIRDVKRLRF